MLIACSAFAQKKDAVDTVRHKFVPTGVRIGTDLISLIRTPADDAFDGFELSGDVDFNHYYLTVETGHWERQIQDKVNTYSNKGNYMRVGVDYNFLKNDPDRNMFFMGMRYGWGSFSERLQVAFDSPVWGPRSEVYTNSNAKATWFELTTGLRVHIWKNLWMGYTARYKTFLSTRGTTNLTAYDVPGYGRTDKESTWGFNYQVFVRIPVRKVK